MRRLAETLDDVAEQAKLYDVTDAAVRGARRHRRRRTFTAAAATMLVMACLVGTVSVASLGGLGVLGALFQPDVGRGPQGGEPPALVKPLLDTPTRGSLAGDTGFLNALEDRIAGDPDAYGLPADRSRIRVLFAGDVPGERRLVLVAGYTERPQMINMGGKQGTSARWLQMANYGDLGEPVVDVTWTGDDRYKPGYAVVLVPAGYDVFLSNAPRYLADGTIRRDWVPEPAGYVVRDSALASHGMRVRVTRGDTVFYESALVAPGPERAGKIDPAPLFGRGKPKPGAAQAAADALAYSTGVPGPYVVLWSDDYVVNEPSGDGSGIGQIATVMAMTPDGGGPYLTLALDTNKEPNGRDHPTGAGVTGDPQRSLIVMRLPHFDAAEPDMLQILAPPAAVRVEVVHEGSVLATAPLSNGVGQVRLTGPLQLTVRAFDVQGAVVAEKAFADLGLPRPSGAAESRITGW